MFARLFICVAMLIDTLLALGASCALVGSPDYHMTRCHDSLGDKATLRPQHPLYYYPPISRLHRRTTRWDEHTDLSRHSSVGIGATLADILPTL